MDEEGVYTRCPRCGGKLHPDREDVVRAVELVEQPRMGGVDVVEGMPAAFHPGCAPHGHPGWRILDD